MIYLPRLQLASRVNISLINYQIQSEGDCLLYPPYRYGLHTPPLSRHAVSLMQYFSNFFIGEVMQNQNRFNNVELFYKLNINNYRYAKEFKSMLKSSNEMLKY